MCSFFLHEMKIKEMEDNSTYSLELFQKQWYSVVAEEQYDSEDNEQGKGLSLKYHDKERLCDLMLTNMSLSNYIISQND